LNVGFLEANQPASGWNRADLSSFDMIIGTIRDLRDVAGRISADQEKCLRLPQMLFKAAVKAV